MLYLSVWWVLVFIQLTSGFQLIHRHYCFQSPHQNHPSLPNRIKSMHFTNLLGPQIILHALPPTTRRQQVSELSLGLFGITLTLAGTSTRTSSDYPLWGVLPLGPYKRKKSLLDVVVPNEIYTIEQKFGILDVQVPVRMVVVVLPTGGLFVYNPLSATGELLALVGTLTAKHGDVKHIVLGTLAIEHKAYAGVFAQKFKSAKVWVNPGQYSFPVSLPVNFLGFPQGRTKEIPRNIEDMGIEVASVFEKVELGPYRSRDGSYGETVFYHKKLKTLLVTDVSVRISDKVPRIFDDDPAPLLYHARNRVEDVVVDNEETRIRGWKRIVLFGLYFNPKDISILTGEEALKSRRSDINRDFYGIYPFTWPGNGSQNESFDALKGGLLVAPILQQLILNRHPEEVLAFADEVRKFNIERIVSAHFDNDVRGKDLGKQFRMSFGFLERGGVKGGMPKPLDGDMKLLKDGEVILVENGALDPNLV